MKFNQLKFYFSCILFNLCLHATHAASLLEQDSTDSQDENAPITNSKEERQKKRSAHTHSAPLLDATVNTTGLQSATNTPILSPESSTVLHEYPWEPHIRLLEELLNDAYQKIYNKLKSSKEILDLQSYSAYLEPFLDIDEALTNEHKRLENLLSDYMNEQSENNKQQIYLKDFILWYGNLLSHFKSCNAPETILTVRELSEKETSEIQEKINASHLKLRDLKTRNHDLTGLINTLNREILYLKGVSDDLYKKNDKFEADYNNHLKSITK